MSEELTCRDILPGGCAAQQNGLAVDRYGVIRDICLLLGGPLQPR